MEHPASFTDTLTLRRTWDQLYKAHVHVLTPVPHTLVESVAAAAVQSLRTDAVPLGCRLWDVAHLLRWHQGTCSLAQFSAGCWSVDLAFRSNLCMLLVPVGADAAC